MTRNDVDLVQIMWHAHYFYPFIPISLKRNFRKKTKKGKERQIKRAVIKLSHLQSLDLTGFENLLQRKNVCHQI